jgi:hypothetical protein
MKARRYTVAALATAAACVTAVLAWPPAPAQTAPPPAAQGAAADAPQATPAQADARAREILMKMAAYLSKLPAFSVRMSDHYDVLQESGEKIEFGERRNVVLQRPNHLRADTERSDGVRTSAVFSGTEIALLDATNKIYASTSQPGGVDESILYFVSDLKMRLPLAMMLMTRLPVELERRVRSVDYVETSYLFGAPAHHLAARGDTVDFQVWVRDGAAPLPLRVVITYKDEPGQPQFSADFTDWNTHPAISAATFRLDRPRDVQKVAFAAQLLARSAPGHEPK